jgi:hypothetical protein
MLSEYEIGESPKIALESAISLEIPMFASRIIFGKSEMLIIIILSTQTSARWVLQSSNPLKGWPFK